MGLEWEQTIVDAHDPESLGRWWCDALGWVVVNEDPDEFEIRPDAERLPGVERPLALGAHHADIGQGDQSWVVLADPEGNEFCVLASRAPASGPGAAGI